MRGIRAVPRNRERTQESQRQARHLLLELDPIGVSDTPEAAGEYDRRIGPLPPSTVPRNRIHHPRLNTRFAAVVTALAGAVPAFGAAAPAAFATPPPPEPGRTGGTAPVVIHTVIVGGMPGGKIIPIAAAAAALAAVAAVLPDHARATRRHMTVPGA